MLFYILIVGFVHFIYVSSIPFPSQLSSSKLDLNDFKLDDFKVQYHELLDSFDLQLKESESGLSKKINFKRPASSVTPPYFKIGEIASNENGETLLKDRTSHVSPSWLANDVYTSTDHGMDSVVKIHKGESGGHFMSGFLGEHLIKWDGKKHNLVPLKEIYDQIDQEIKETFDSEIELGLLSEFPGLKRKVRQETANATEDDNDDDEEDDHIPLQEGRGIDTGPSIGYPEVLFIVDYNISKHFDFDEKKIIDYLSVMINSINLRYSDVPDPKLSFILSGIYLIKTPDVETLWPWLNNGRLDHHKLIKQIGNFGYNNIKTLPVHDLIALITSNKFNGSVTGLAKVRGACGMIDQLQLDEGVSINHDYNGVWYGKHTLVHEFAHNLGSFHDGHDDSAACSWELGHIMSYKGWAELSKMKFSTCSIASMKRFLLAKNSDCLRKNESTPIGTTSDVINDRLDIPEICKAIFQDVPGEPKHLDHGDLNRGCRVLYCQYKGPQTIFGNFIPENKMKCGRSGTCLDGFCINDTPYTERKELDDICKEKFDDPTAVWNPDSDLKVACTRISCQVGPLTTSQPLWMGNGAPCGNGGTCTDGNCIGSKPFLPTDRELFNEKCKQKTNYPGSKYLPKILPNPKTACNFLPCKKEGSGATLIPFSMGDDFPCGSGGKCQAGECVGG